MEQLVTFWEFLSTGRGSDILRAVFVLGLGWALAGILSALVQRFFNHLDRQHLFIFKRTVYYVILGLAIVSALRELGFNLGALLGAAGILTVAIGFASQTSASNLISGLFLLGEKPFQIGDFIKVDQTIGEVLSIDLLSVKLRTFDNLFVRVPNESLIKSMVINLSRFPIRRLDLQLSVAYKEKLDKVYKILEHVAAANAYCLEEPKPLVIFQGYGTSSLDIQFSVWAQRDHFLDLRNSITREIKEAFDEDNIEIPFPHVSLYAGEATSPIPIKMVSDGDSHKKS